MSSHIKTELSPPPPLLASFEAGGHARRCFVLTLCIGLLWIALGAGDWFMRFHWFGWHRNFVIRPVAAQSASVSAVVKAKEAERGGDLSKLIGIPKVAERYEEQRPGATNFVDEAGYRNAPDSGSNFTVVVVGDSYAATGPRFEDCFAAQLGKRLGIPVYNHAAEGRGTFWAAVRFFSSEHFRGREPRVVVWPLIEREIAGEYFAGGYFQIKAAGGAASNAAASAARVDWNQLTPAMLRKSLPNSSRYSQVAGRVWNRSRYELFGQVNPVVIPAATDVTGGPMLFYSEGIRAHRWTDEQRALPAVARALGGISQLAKARGMVVLFVLVPDKERVYSAALPSHVRDGVRPSFLPLIEAELRKEGLNVVNLLPDFLRHAEGGGALLYWRDDTHWNPAGVALATELVAPAARNLLEGAGAQ